MATNYNELRSTYDLAFRQLARQLQYVNDLQILADAGSNRLLNAQEELAMAQCCYVTARNALASYLLARQSQNGPATAEPHTIHAIKERAYFFWENTGRPSGNDQANWFRAQASLSLHTVPRPCASC